MIDTVEVEVAGQLIQIETGRVAKQANGAVLVRSGDTIVLCTATMSREARTDIDFFPLVVDYEERKYSVGKIPGGFIKRGGRPSDKAVLTSRLIDRPLRPLFPSGMRNEVQVIAMPLSVDNEHLPDVLSIIGASAALTVSNIPFNGPVGAVRIGKVNGEFIINPSFDQVENGDLDLVVAGTKDYIVMVEAGANEVSEAEILAALQLAHEHIKPICAIQEELAAKVGTVKAEVPLYVVPEDILTRVREQFAEQVLQAIQQPDKSAREEAIELLKEEIVQALLPEYPERETDLREAADKVVKEQVRRLILEHKVRPDGRKYDEIRPISCMVGLLPRVHGSALFTRGQTQVLTSVTLGPMEEAQIIDTLEEDGFKRYMHFYNFPPYSVGETRPLRGPGRREIGHGALAERALRPTIPPEEEFPYAILLTSEVLESNGSTSMASVCGSTLALMDAGVQIKAPVAGVAMGLMMQGDEWAVLSDIQGMEDFSGDMDFKVAGTARGITALQLDTKISGIPQAVFERALEQARQGRLYILEKMLETIDKPRDSISSYAPRIIVMEIHPDRIGDVIGPGGRIIKKILADTGTRIQIEQDGRVYIAADDEESGERARKMIEDLTRDVTVGETFLGKVTRTSSLGVFVEILPGKEGLVPLSQLSEQRVRRADELVKVGDEILVKVVEIDNLGRINLSARGLHNVFSRQAASSQKPAPRAGGGGHEPSGYGRGGELRRHRGDDDTPRARFRPKR
jgi:polyribonucleotide nucleotidyltransferase